MISMVGMWDMPVISLGNLLQETWGVQPTRMGYNMDIITSSELEYNRTRSTLVQYMWVCLKTIYIILHNIICVYVQNENMDAPENGICWYTPKIASLIGKITNGASASMG